MELVMDRLTKQYEAKTVVDKISLKMKQGVYGLLGANGAGKTTLMRMICGVLKPTAGEVKFNGIDVNEEDYRDNLGYLPQDFGYYPEFTATEFLHYMASLKGLTNECIKERTSELIELVALTDVAKDRIKTFSGGMKQRIGIAQALLNNPKILILDEPTAGLDPKERIRFRNMISGLGSDRIVLLSTHIVSDIESIASTVLVMKNGQIIQNGSPDEVISIIEGKVFECTVDSITADRLVSELPVANIRKEGKMTFLRVISDEPPCDGAIHAQAALEDLYLYHFSELSEVK